MPNKEIDNEEYEARELRMKVALVIGCVLLAIAAIFAFTQYQNKKENEKKLTERKHKITEIKKHNKKADKESIETKKEAGIYDVSQSSAKFYNKFFDWSSWGEYRDNMKELRQKYPKIDEGKTVNLSGNKISENPSPESTHTKRTFVGEKKGQIGEFVTQSKEYPDDTQSQAIWYVLAEKKDNQLDIKSMKAYRDAK